MSHVDLDSLKENVYYITATLDRRYIWEKIPPEEIPVDEDHAYSGFDRYRIVDCAHREEDRDGDTCGHCGESFAKTKRSRKR